MRHGDHNGMWVQAVAKAVKAAAEGEDITAAWMIEHTGLSYKQAYNALQHAYRTRQLNPIKRGHYALCGAA